MSKSAWVAVVAGVLLVGALGVIVQREWAALDMKHDVLMIVCAGVTLYAAITSALLIRRIADPDLEIPILAIIAVVIFWIIEIFGEASSDNRRYGSSYSSSSSYTSSSSPSTKGMGLFGAIAGTIISLAFYGGGLAILFYVAKDRHEHASHAEAKESKPAPAKASKPEPPPEPADLAGAIAAAKPHFTDDRKAPSAGAKELARWLAAHGKFADLKIDKNQTSPALVEKDPMSEAGKRLCVSGTLTYIEKQSMDGTSMFAARLVTADNDPFQLVVLGGTGDLVKKSKAKFCGVVAGRLDLNATPETFAVGMFDVPAER